MIMGMGYKVAMVPVVWERGGEVGTVTFAWEWVNGNARVHGNGVPRRALHLSVRMGCQYGHDAISEE